MMVVYLVAILIGVTLVVLGLVYRTPNYLVPGLMWLIVDSLFLCAHMKGVDVHDVIGNRHVFAFLFMAIPAYVLGYFVLKETYRHHHVWLRYVMYLVILVDTVHLIQTSPELFVILAIVFLVVRRFNPAHYDDLHPLIPVERRYLD